MPSNEAHKIIAAVRRDIEQAADALLSAAEKGLLDVRAAKLGQAGALDRVETMLCAILEACVFQDIAGQRLSQLERVLGPVAPPVDSLLNGPASAGDGLDQDTADRLMNVTWPR